MRRGARRAAWALEDALLEAEGRLGVLGPVHRRWRGNSPADNRASWDHWDWSRLGEEWSASEEWKQGLIDDVLLRLVPVGGVVLEIGPGGGRWTRVIAPRGQRTIVADVSPVVLDLVAREVPGVEVVRSPGAALPGVADASVDAVWSFDVFVHVAPVDQAAYLREVARVLRPGGVAAIHHADGRNHGAMPSRAGWRAPMSERLFAALARRAGLRPVEVVRSWSAGRHDLGAFGDAITVLRAG